MPSANGKEKKIVLSLCLHVQRSESCVCMCAWHMWLTCVLICILISGIYLHSSQVCVTMSCPCQLMQAPSALESSMSYLIREYMHVLQRTYNTIWEAASASHCKTNIWAN